MPRITDLQGVANPVESLFSIYLSNQPYAGLWLMPPFMVDEYSGQFWKYDPADAFTTLPDLKRAFDGTAYEVDWKPSLASFSTTEKANKTWMSDRNEMHADEAVRPSAYATNIVVNNILLDHEKAVAAIATDTAQLTQNVTLSLATQKYTDKLNSTPLDDASTARLAMKFVPYAASLNPGSGMLVAIMAPPVVEALRLHPDILGMFTNQDGPLSLSNIAEALGVNRVIVSAAQKTVAGTTSYVWNNDIVFAWVNPARQRNTMTFGFTPMTRMPGTGELATNVPADGIIAGDNRGLGIRVFDYRQPSKGGGGTWREADTAWGLNVVLPQLAYLIKSAV